MKGRITIEMMGAPTKIVEDALKKVEERIRADFKVSNVKYAEPRKVGETYFSIYFEMELEFETLDKLFGFVIDYGPSTFEILETKPISVQPVTIENSANDVSATLHALLKQITMLQAQMKMSQRAALEEKVKAQQELKAKETKEKPSEKKKPLKTPKKKKK